MDIKTYLGKVKELHDKVLDERDYIASLRTTLEAGGIRYDKEPSSGSGDTDRFHHVVITICDEEKKLKNLEEDQVNFQVHVLEQIHRMDNITHKDILKKVYIEFKTLRRSADEIGFSYEWIKKHHPMALEEFEIIHADTLDIHLHYDL